MAKLLQQKIAHFKSSVSLELGEHATFVMSCREECFQKTAANAMRIASKEFPSPGQRISEPGKNDLDRQVLALLEFLKKHRR
jgi:hypothetical protein